MCATYSGEFRKTSIECVGRLAWRACIEAMAAECLAHCFSFKLHLLIAGLSEDLSVVLGAWTTLLSSLLTLARSTWVWKVYGEMMCLFTLLYITYGHGKFHVNSSIRNFLRKMMMHSILIFPLYTASLLLIRWSVVKTHTSDI